MAIAPTTLPLGRRRPFPQPPVSARFWSYILTAIFSVPSVLPSAARHAS